jgi:molecular chaperone DnaJ
MEGCEPCSGSGAKPGTGKTNCSTCNGRGQVSRSAGFFQMASPCPTCRGAGQVIESPCQTCSGSGGVQSRTEIEIQVPPGVEEGVQLRVTAEGDAGPNGAARGDLYCVIREKEHKVFQRSGPDVLRVAARATSCCACFARSPRTSRIARRSSWRNSTRSTARQAASDPSLIA